jgi:hypothetical protein
VAIRAVAFDVGGVLKRVGPFSDALLHESTAESIRAVNALLGMVPGLRPAFGI